MSINVVANINPYGRMPMAEKSMVAAALFSVALVCSVLCLLPSSKGNIPTADKYGLVVGLPAFVGICFVIIFAPRGQKLAMFGIWRFKAAEVRVLRAYGWLCILLVAADALLWAFTGNWENWGAVPTNFGGLIAMWLFFFRGIYLWKTGAIAQPRTLA